MRIALVLLVLTCLGCDLDLDASKGSRIDTTFSETTQQRVADSLNVETQGGSRKQRITEHSLKPSVPANEAIESIFVEANGHPLPFLEDIALFELPRKYFDKVLTPFRNVDLEIDNSANLEHPELGSARIKYFGGRSVRVSWFWSGHKDRLSFSYSGIRYRTAGKRFATDETLTFDATIRQIYSEISGPSVK